MAKSPDELRKGFFAYQGIDPNAAIAPGAEQEFYSKFINYVWLASEGPSPFPALESLYGGYFRAKGITADTEVPPGSEVSFYDGFVMHVQDTAAKAPKNPYQSGTRENPIRTRTQGNNAF